MLTRREREVLTLIEQGYRDREIGAALVIELGGVKTHVRNILRKLNVPDRKAAAKAWRRIEQPQPPVGWTCPYCQREATNV